MKDAVYLVWHTHISDDGSEDVKLIGVYSTAEKAQGAVERAKDQPGFHDTPDGFEISRYEIDKDHWTEGFITVSNDD
jgi:homoserine kinase type II